MKRAHALGSVDEVLHLKECKNSSGCRINSLKNTPGYICGAIEWSCYGYYGNHFKSRTKYAISEIRQLLEFTFKNSTFFFLNSLYNDSLVLIYVADIIFMHIMRN